MTSSAGEMRLLRAGEWLTVLISAVNCVLVPAVFAQSQRPLFPLPGLYFVQIALLGVLVLAFVAARPQLRGRWAALPWLAAGVTLAFVILGGFSIGLFLIPAFIGFVITGVFGDLQAGGAMGRHVGYLLVAAVAQAAVMGLMILF